MVYRKTYCLVRRSFFKRKVLGNRMVMTFASKSGFATALSCAVNRRDSLPLRRIDNFKNSLKFIEIINHTLINLR